MMPSKKKVVLLRHGNPQGNPANAPRCGAKTRRGTPCRSPAMANGRCRMHGGKSHGPVTEAGLARSRKARYKTGRYSAENEALRQEIRTAMAGFQATLTWLRAPPKPDDPQRLDLLAQLSEMLNDLPVLPW